MDIVIRFCLCSGFGVVMEMMFVMWLEREVKIGGGEGGGDVASCGDVFCCGGDGGCWNSNSNGDGGEGLWW